MGKIDSDAERVVRAYLDAIGDRDFDRARRYLADADFHHRSPISSFQDPDAYIADIARIGAILERIEPRKLFIDGDDVCVIVDYVTHMARRNVTPVVHWMSVTKGKIVSIETIFDASEYIAMFNAD